MPADRSESVIIMSVREYIRNIAPTPAAYRAIRKEARKNGSGALSMSEIDREITALRRSRKKRSRSPSCLTPRFRVP